MGIAKGNSHWKTVTAEELGKILYQKSSGFFDIVKAKAIFEIVEKDGDTIFAMLEMSTLAN